MILWSLKKWWQTSPEELERRRIAHERYLAKLAEDVRKQKARICLLYTSPSPRDRTRSRMPSSA